MGYEGPHSLTVAAGGTGAASYNTNGAVISGTSSTASLASVALANQKFLVGNTSAAPTAKAFSIVIQTFTSTQTYTPTSGMVYCVIECVGGGGGGGTAAIVSGQYSAGSGGGGGEYAMGTFSAATIGASQSVTIGSGGASATGGGDTSVGALISAKGASAGTDAVSTTNGTAKGYAGGAGGTGGAGGSLRFAGGDGGSSWTFSVGGQVDQAESGYGGSSRFSQSVKGTPVFDGTANQATVGTAATGYGGGGAGGLNYGNEASSTAGGAGSAGIVIVTEYVIS